MRGRRYLSSTRPSGGAANAKQQKPIRARTPLSECKAAYCYIYFTFILAFKKSVRNPEARRQVSKRNVPMPVALLAQVTRHSAMSCTSGRAQWSIKPLQCAPNHTPRHRSLERDAPQNRHRRPHSPEPPSRRLPDERSALAADRERSTSIIEWQRDHEQTAHLSICVSVRRELDLQAWCAGQAHAAEEYARAQIQCRGVLYGFLYHKQGRSKQPRAVGATGSRVKHK
jgi:hypothetical protein